MAKIKTKFVCQECGYESAGWIGKCPACEKWNSFVEEQIIATTSSSSKHAKAIVSRLSEISIKDKERYTTGSQEMDRVLGGGLVPGSLVLVGGDPGIGKSTLLLQICDKVSIPGDILYVTAEESLSQVKMRGNRLGVNKEQILMMAETDFSSIHDYIEKNKPGTVIIDSIQTVFSSEISSSPGSVSQVRYITNLLMQIAKKTGVTVIIVGHVTKEGTIAGPKVLEHMVDTVLYFEGEKTANYRILRAVKNRFGSTNELGVFEMTSRGLEQVKNPSLIMISGRARDAAGSCITAAFEGTRPMLIEIQALVSPTSFGVPRRMASGTDYNRVTMLMAVLEKRVGLKLYNCDAYVNIAGGIRIVDPACDLGIIGAVASSYKNLAIDSKTIMIGEVGLTGEIRSCSGMLARITEAKRIGFNRCLIPESSMTQDVKISSADFKVIGVSNVAQALDLIF